VSGLHGENGGKNMHRAGNNILFGDTHVAAVREMDLGLITFNPPSLQSWERRPASP